MVDIILKSLITIVVAIWIAYMAPILKTRLDNDKLDQIKRYAEIAVKCAEQVFSKEEFKRKKEYACAYLREKAMEHSISVTQADIDYIVESVVNELKR